MTQLSRKVMSDAAFVEADHPRDDVGRFTQSYRRNTARSDSPINPEIGYSMWVRAERGDSVNGYGPHAWEITPEKVIGAEELRDLIRPKFIKQYEQGSLSYELEKTLDAAPGDTEEERAESFLQEINPSNIVDSAGALDDRSFLSWLWDNYDHILEDTGIETQDGLVTFDVRNARLLTETAATDAAPRKLTYFGTRISPNQIVSKQGYLVCMNVPICRTGMQSYLGSELQGHPGYDPEWGLLPHERYDVLRPLEEVTDPATVASFEGVTVTDEHPDASRYPGSLLTSENDNELHRGHVQNVRVGEPLPESGETPLIADLHIKAADLIQKVDDGIRDVSCGYTFRLVRRPDGHLVQTRIRGNHLAAGVPKGRAGKEVAIGDAEPKQPAKETTPVKNMRNYLFGLGLKAYAALTDSDPEKLAEMAKEAAKDEESDEAKDKKVAEEKAAKDAEAADEKKKAEEKAAADAAAKAAADTKVEDLEEPSEAAVIDDGEKVEEVETGDASLKGKGALDSMRELIKTLKPIMGSGQMPKAAVDSYNNTVKALNDAKGTKNNPYAAFVNVSKPELAAVDADKNVAVNMGQFFNGVTYEVGMKRYNDYLAQKGAK